MWVDNRVAVRGTPSDAVHNNRFILKTLRRAVNPPDQRI
jgi:hypothetical protein